jgi:hypothetical protein
VGVSDEDANPDQVARVEIRVRIRCECGEVAVAELSPEQARRFATGLNAAADGLERVEVEVHGAG